MIVAAPSVAVFKISSAIILWLSGLIGGLLPTCFQEKRNTDPFSSTNITSASDTANNTTNNTTNIPNKSARLLSILNCFAGGIFLAASMIHLLPDATDNPALAKLGCPTDDNNNNNELASQNLNETMNDDNKLNSPLLCDDDGQFWAYFIYGLGFLLMVFVDNFAQSVNEQNDEYHHHDHPTFLDPEDRIYEASDPLLSDTIISSSYGSNHDSNTILDNRNSSTNTTKEEIRCLNTRQDTHPNENDEEGQLQDCGTNDCLTDHQVYYSLKDEEEENECVGLLSGTTTDTATSDFNTTKTDKYINDDEADDRETLETSVSSSDNSTTVSTATSPIINTTNTTNNTIDHSTDLNMTESITIPTCSDPERGESSATTTTTSTTPLLSIPTNTLISCTSTLFCQKRQSSIGTNTSTNHNHTNNNPIAHGHAHGLINPSKLTASAVFLSLCFHSVMEGLAIGSQNTDAWDIFIAIFAHKAFAAFALGLELVSHCVQGWRMVWSMLIFSFMTPLGIGIGSLCVWIGSSSSSSSSSSGGTYETDDDDITTQAQESLASGICTALSGGTFLFVAVMEIIPQELQNRKDQGWKCTSLVLGYLFFGVLGIYV